MVIYYSENLLCNSIRLFYRCVQYQSVQKYINYPQSHISEKMRLYQKLTVLTVISRKILYSWHSPLHKAQSYYDMIFYSSSEWHPNLVSCSFLCS